MKKTGFILSKIVHALKGTKRPKLTAIILAGGSGTRLGMHTTKQMVEINGKSIVAHTLLAFEECLYVDEIIVAAKKDEIPLYREIQNKYNITKLKAVTCGGDTRQISAMHAFDKADVALFDINFRSFLHVDMTITGRCGFSITI